MEYYEEQCTVVFVTELAFKVCVEGGRGSPRPIRFRDNFRKDDCAVHCSPDSSMVQNMPPKVYKFMQQRKNTINPKQNLKIFERKVKQYCSNNRMQRGSVGSALACCKAGPRLNLGSAPHGGSAR